MMQPAIEQMDGMVILPLYLYDHSGITMNTCGFSCPWDSGQVGWIYADKAMIEQEHGKITPEILEKVRQTLEAEVKEYDYYLTNGTKTTDTNYGEMADGKLNVSKPNAAHWENRDPRLYATLFVPGMYWNGKGGENAWYGGASASLSTVYVMKYFDPTDTSNSWDNGQDFYVVRYAEVLLSLAEALVQKGGYDEAEILGLVNQIRQRGDVNMPKVEDVEGTGLSKEALLEVIRHERRVELAFEGLRLFDVYRWKMLDKAVANIEKERTTLGLAYEPRQYNGERDYVWPIPTSELDSNKLLEQHELWK